MIDQRSNALSYLRAAQNPDGGWGYRGGASWTEPSAYALLALSEDPPGEEHVRRGIQWLLSLQRPDGGWPPRSSVRHSTFVTALALLALAGKHERAAASAARWLLQQTGQESTFVRRLRLRLLGTLPQAETFDGWPWYPGAAAWVTPTALTLVALAKAARSISDPKLRTRLESGTDFLWSRVCRDGGWNHGAFQALGYESVSYPETTGVALLALRGRPAPKLAAALAAGEGHYHACRSAEGVAWLRLGLLAHSRLAAHLPAKQVRCYTVVDHGLTALALQPVSENHPLLG
jgi:squalene cyclase